MSIKNSVNLLREEFKPQITLLSVNFCLAIWGAALLLMIVYGMLVNSQYQQSQNNLQSTQSQLRSKQGLLDTLTIAKEALSKDPNLIADIKREQQRVALKQNIVAELAKRENLRNKGFSALMLDLAEHHNSDVWLTQISLNESKLHIEGGALASASVPQWLDGLRTAPYFMGAEFAAARMYRDEQQQIRFILSSELSIVEGGANE